MIDKKYREFGNWTSGTLSILNNNAPYNFDQYKHVSWLHIMGLIETINLVNTRPYHLIQHDRYKRLCSNKNANNQVELKQ